MSQNGDYPSIKCLKPGFKSTGCKSPRAMNSMKAHLDCGGPWSPFPSVSLYQHLVLSHQDARRVSHTQSRPFRPRSRFRNDRESLYLDPSIRVSRPWLLLLLLLVRY